MPSDPAGGRDDAPSEVGVLAEIGRTILDAQLDEDQLCELIYHLAGKIVVTDTFQLGLIDGDRYTIKVWQREGEAQSPTVFVVAPNQGLIGWMRESRRAVLVKDFETEMESLPFRPTYRSVRPPRSAAYIPLVVADAVIGVLSVQSTKPNAFREEDVRLLSVLANQAASALNNARLFRRSQRRLMDLTAVAEVGRRISRLLDLNELLAQVVALIQSHFGYYHVQIFLVPQGSNRAYFVASSGHGLNEKWQKEGRSLRIGEEGIIGWVAEHAEPLVVNDVTQEPRYIPDDPRLLPDTRSELAVPLLIEDTVVGVLDIQSTGTGTFSEDDLFIVRTLADQVAVAVSSARAYEAQREEAWVTTVMLQVAEATSQAGGIEEVLDAAVRVTAMLAGVESSMIWLLDEDSNCFEYGASFGLAEAGPEDRPAPDDFGALELASLVDESGHPISLPAEQSSSQPMGQQSLRAALRFLAGDWPTLDRLREAKTPAVISLDNIFLPHVLRRICPGDTLALLPMLNKGQVFGILGVSFSREDAPSLNERRLAMLSGIAHQVAAAVDSSRLAAAREEEAWVLTVLLQVAEAIGRFQPIDTTLIQVAQITPLLAGVDRCAVLLREEQGNFVVRQVHATRPSLADVYTGAVIRTGELPLLDDACRLGQPLVVDDVERNPRVPAAWRARYNSRTLLVVPMLVADEVVGALLADDVDSAHRFSPRRVRILNGIASQTAVAIENARLQAQETANVRLAHELELGHTIQRSLLPQAAPTLPGYQLVYRWRSAREVGGDFFDFVPLPSGELGIVVADVSDKGIPAALYMMFARTLLRSIAFSGRSPAATLARTNELTVTDNVADMFVTVYYSVLNARKHVLTYASAGHNLAFYAPAGGQPQTITTNGLALGIIAPVTFEQKEIALNPGDAVIFYTDGVTDARNTAGESFGEERLVEVLAAYGDAPAEAMADAIDGALRTFVGSSAQYDDVTLVILKREG